ncbi:23S rRNA pseudouridine1911/1915/1917 synthase [Kroppenstedtia sanguinis]|uniref:Pseudouridine synthase n=1 Tax=Kroppenstedtia sanguinis TaxID=1380684 RepID=A0ABW4C9P9_9BACL
MTAEGEIHSWQVEESDRGERVDKFLAGKEADWSRMVVQSWIREHRVRVEGRLVKSNYRLQSGEQVEVTVPPPEEPEVKPEALPLEVVFEDGDVMVVNKPRGMVVHPAPGNPSGTLVNALLAHCDHLSRIGGELRPGIVHRIDKDTSGLIMVAKNDAAHRSLVTQLKNHTVDREYTALVQGNIPHDRGTVDAPIGRDPHDRKRMAVEHSHGKAAVTHFEVIERFSRATWIRCRLETGRTHQIRVHMKSIGHPLVGDPIYSHRSHTFPIKGQALHARLLGFDHPRTGERICREVEMPEDMQSLVAGFRRESL